MKPDRDLPVRPDLNRLTQEAAQLRGERQLDPREAQELLAHSYGAPSWERLVQCCQLIDAIWNDDVDTLRDLVTRHPNLLHENAGIRNSNWGPPLTYAANLGRDRIIRMLYDLGARDLETAVGRAILQSKIETARMLHQLMGSPRLPDSALGGAAYTLSATGTQLVLELGGRAIDENGNWLAPVDLVLETDSRNPEAKHRILELYVQHGLTLPDTPVMALHRGRLDLLADHLRRDLRLLQRTFRHEDIYPPDLGCHDETLATQGTPLKGTTLLHLCADYNEIEIARWLLDQGMDPNARAEVDDEGF